MSGTRRPLLVGALAAAVIALVASGALAVGALRGGVGPGGHGFLSSSFLSGSQRSAPKLPGTVVNVSLTNMGGPMMGGQGATMMGRGGMGLIADHATAAHHGELLPAFARLPGSSGTPPASRPDAALAARNHEETTKKPGENRWRAVRGAGC